MFKSLIIAFVAVISSPAWANISGTYVGSGPDIAVLLQVVETNGGQLSGRYEQQKIAGNKLERLNASVSGTSDGQTVVLQVHPTEVLAGTYVLSGTISGTSLQIGGGGYGQTFSLNLAKGTEEEFKNNASGLSASVNRAVATQTLDVELTNAEHTLEAFSKFSSNPEPKPSAFFPYEQRYRALTQAMRAALGRQQSIPRFVQTPARGQIGVAINQAAIETTQIHDEVKAKQADLQQKATAALERVMPVANRCKNPSAQANISPQTLEKLKVQCARIPSAVKQFVADIKQINSYFDWLESVWRDEKEQQQAIVQSADIAAR
jgi:hypothetical protein